MSYDGDKAEAPKAKPNPFGAARPREQVIAERLGKKETEVLKEQAQKDWKPSATRLTEAEYEEKKAAEAELAYAKSDLEKAVDPVRIKELQEDVAAKEKKLDELISSFEQKASVQRPRRDKRKDEVAETQEYGGSFSRGRGGRDERQAYPDAQEYGSFSRGRGGRESDRGGAGAYGDAWGGSKGRTSQSQCYSCGEVGHFSRECPNMRGGSGNYGGSFGGGRSGGGKCYTCNEEGHIARECPRSQGGGGGYGGRSYGTGGYGYSQDYESGYRNQGGYDNYGGSR